MGQFIESEIFTGGLIICISTVPNVPEKFPPVVVKLLRVTDTPRSLGIHGTHAKRGENISLIIITIPAAH